MDKKFLLKYSFNNGDTEHETSRFMEFNKFHFRIDNTTDSGVKKFILNFKLNDFCNLDYLCFKSEGYGRSSMVDFLTSLQKAFERQDLSCVKISLHFDKFSMSFIKSLGEECKLIGEYETQSVE